MNTLIGRQGHGVKLNLVDGFIKRSFLFSSRFRADVRKVEMLSTLFYVVRHHPVGRHHFVVPPEFGFVGVAAVARIFEDLFYLRRRLQVRGYWGTANLRAHKLEAGEDEQHHDERCFYHSSFHTDTRPAAQVNTAPVQSRVAISITKR